MPAVLITNSENGDEIVNFKKVRRIGQENSCDEKKSFELLLELYFSICRII